MEIGALIGAAPKEKCSKNKTSTRRYCYFIRRKTGRDGCGGATGSSKAHTSESLTTCGAEVQKRKCTRRKKKYKRLFRNVKQQN